MIVPVYLDAHCRIPVEINERICLVDEGETIIAYNTYNKKLGFLSPKTFKNKKLLEKSKCDSVNGKIWAIFKNKILVELL